MAGETMRLKLVRGATYACPKVNNGEPIVKGTVIEVDAAVGEKLLEDTYRDASNNDHQYFQEVTGDVGEDDDTADAPAKAPAKTAAKRTRSAK